MIGSRVIAAFIVIATVILALAYPWGVVKDFAPVIIAVLVINLVALRWL